MQKKLINFLQQNLSIPADSIQLAVRQRSGNSNQLPIILWQYGLITREQLELIFDWLETV